MGLSLLRTRRWLQPGRVHCGGFSNVNASFSPGQKQAVLLGKRAAAPFCTAGGLLSFMQCGKISAACRILRSAAVFQGVGQATGAHTGRGGDFPASPKSEARVKRAK